MNLKLVSILWENGNKEAKMLCYKVVDNLIPDQEFSIGFTIKKTFKQKQQGEIKREIAFSQVGILSVGEQ